jgi:hypothetical protein
VKIKHLVIAALVLFGIVAMRFLIQTDGKKIRTQFNLLAAWVSKQPDESLVTTSYNVQHIATLFADPCVFTADVISLSGSYTPDEISGLAGRSRFSVSYLALKFYDLNIIFVQEGMAQATVTAKLTGKTKSGDILEATHELKTVLIKTEGKWRFSRVEVVEVLQK